MIHLWVLPWLAKCLDFGAQVCPRQEVLPASKWYSSRSPDLLPAWLGFECVPGRMVDLHCMMMVRQGRSEPWPGVVSLQKRGESSPVCGLIRRPWESMVLPMFGSSCQGQPMLREASLTVEVACQDWVSSPISKWANLEPQSDQDCRSRGSILGILSGPHHRGL